jgi:hypothetical protein
MVDIRPSGDGGFQLVGDNMARGEDTLMNIQVGDPNTSSCIIQSPRKLENNVTIDAQYVIDQCKRGSGVVESRSTTWE